MNIREFYKLIKLTTDKEVIVNSVTNSTEELATSQFNFYSNVNIDNSGLGVSEGTGTSTVEIVPGNQYEFFKRIKLDNDGNIKVKYK